MENVGAILATVIGSVVSAVLTHIIIKRIGGGEKPQTHAPSVSVVGDGAHVRQDNRKNDFTVINHVYNDVSANGHSTVRRADASDDPWAEIILTIVGGLALALAYLLVWPFVVGLLLGASVAVACTTAASMAGPTGSRRTRQLVRVQAIVSVVATAATGFWIWRGGPWGTASSTLEARVAAAIPDFGAGLGDKWQVLATRTPEVIGALGLPGVTSLASYAAASMACLMLLSFAARAVGQWWAIRAVVDGGNRDERLVRRAHNLQRAGVGGLVATLVLGVVSLSLASGVVEVLASTSQG